MKTRRKIDKTLALFITLFVISSIMLLSNESFRTTKEMALTMFSVFQRGFDRAIKGSISTISSVNELKDLKNLYELQKKELVEYRGIERNLLELKRQNIRLKELLNFKNLMLDDSIACGIIGKDPSNISSAFTISKGASSGIKVDMPVIAGQDGIMGIVGKIISVGSYSSLVLPLLDQSSYIASRLFDSRYEGLARGLGSVEGKIELDYIKKIALPEISLGDLVTSSGMNSIYPKGYYIGRVVAIKKVEYETSLKITLKPIIDFSRLEDVFVLIINRGLNE